MTESTDGAPDRAGDGDLVIIPSPEHPDLALVLGQDPIPDRLGQVVATAPAAALRALQSAGVLSQAMAIGATGTGRWVQLTSESAGELARLGPTMDATGSHALGVLRGSGGGFEHVVQFQGVGILEPAGAALLGGLAVQATLVRIEKQLERLANKVDLLLEASSIEVEAKVVSGLTTIRQVERRLAAQGIVDDDDWAALSSDAADIRQAYHQVLKWLVPLRSLLTAEDARIGPLVAELEKAVVLRDVATWIRLYVWAELAMKRWELLYMIRQMTVSPELVASEAQHIQQEAAGRTTELRSLLDDLTNFLARDPDDLVWQDRIRLVHRYRLGLLRRQVAEVLNIYATSLSQAEVEVPEYLDPEGDAATGPLLMVENLQERLARGAATALGAGVEAGKEVADRIGDVGGRAAVGLGRTLKGSRFGRLLGGGGDEAETTAKPDEQP